MDSPSTHIDIGLTHIALPVSDVDRSIAFYTQYAGMQVIHRRMDAATGVAVVWLSDRTRPFAIVLNQWYEPRGKPRSVFRPKGRGMYPKRFKPQL